MTGAENRRMQTVIFVRPAFKESINLQNKREITDNIFINLKTADGINLTGDDTITIAIKQMVSI